MGDEKKKRKTTINASEEANERYYMITTVMSENEDILSLAKEGIVKIKGNLQLDCNINMDGLSLEVTGKIRSSHPNNYDLVAKDIKADSIEKMGIITAHNIVSDGVIGAKGVKADSLKATSVEITWEGLVVSQTLHITGSIEVENGGIVCGSSN